MMMCGVRTYLPMYCTPGTRKLIQKNVWKKRVSAGKKKNSPKKAVQNKSGGAGRFKMC